MPRYRLNKCKLKSQTRRLVLMQQQALNPLRLLKLIVE